MNPTTEMFRQTGGMASRYHRSPGVLHKPPDRKYYGAISGFRASRGHEDQQAFDFSLRDEVKFVQQKTVMRRRPDARGGQYIGGPVNKVRSNLFS